MQKYAFWCKIFEINYLGKVMKALSPEDQQELDSLIKGIAKIMHRNTDPEKIETFERMELAVREQLLTEIGPVLMKNFYQKAVKGLQGDLV